MGAQSIGEPGTLEANEREHLKIDIWIVIDPEGLILDRADGPEHPGSTIVIVETKLADWKLVRMPAMNATCIED